MAAADTRALCSEGVASPTDGPRQYRAPVFNAPELDGSLKRGPLAMRNEQDREFESYNRGREINYWGCMVFALYFVAFGFYLWVRITKTLDLAGYLWCARSGLAGVQAQHTFSRVLQGACGQEAACAPVQELSFWGAEDQEPSSRHACGQAATLMPLMPPRRYGIIVLVVEGMGFTTVVLYGVNLLFNPVIMVYEEDINNPGKPITRRPYHARVCVPCYKESLEIIRRTVMALYDAELPEVAPAAAAGVLRAWRTRHSTCT